MIDTYNHGSFRNVSFNLRGEAIVDIPTDATRPSFGSGMDGLIIGKFLFEK
jgi:predicted NodU family carbamoyl transferase